MKQRISFDLARLLRSIKNGLLPTSRKNSESGTTTARKAVWIASYPRSGNSWLRFMLSAYFCEATSSWDKISAVVLEFPALVGRLAAGKSKEQLWDEMCHMHDSLGKSFPRKGLPEGLYLKTHSVAANHLYAEKTKHAVLLVRNPRDVLVSAVNYKQLLMQSDMDKSFESSYLDQFTRNGGDPDWKKIGFGTWQEHYFSWTSQPFPTHVVRYEDLRNDTESSLRKILTFLGVIVEDERLHRAVEECRLENLQKLEERLRQGSQHPFRNSARRFINKGLVGYNISEQYDWEAFREGMQVLGYT
jgi:hypothetical protein